SAVGIPNGAQFHPLKYFCGIAKELRLFGYARAIEIRDGRVLCDGGSITADNIVVATHFPFINKFGGYFLKMYQQRSYVLALGGIPADRLPQGMYIDEETGGLSFRRWGDMLLLGGGSARTGCTGDALERLRAEALRLYPEAKIAAAWAAQDCMTLDGMPYVGQYSRRLPNVYVATGFNKWGMTSSMAAAMILRDALLGKPNEYAAVFSPARSMLHPQLAKNLASTFGNFCRIAPRCPHLGCALKYNKYEHSWDCPCHGSRFDERGGLLDGPAQGDKRGL
ncbi:MAG: FAD-dependent oxidoreductase, partial [Acutalibacteraceae bacterium]